MSASARLTSWFVRRSRRSASWSLRQLHRARLGRVPGADQVNDLRDDADKLAVHLPDLTEQIRLVLGDKPQPLQVVTELVQLAQCGG